MYLTSGHLMNTKTVRCAFITVLVVSENIHLLTCFRFCSYEEEKHLKKKRVYCSGCRRHGTRRFIMIFIIYFLFNGMGFGIDFGREIFLHSLIYVTDNCVKQEVTFLLIMSHIHKSDLLI